MIFKHRMTDKQLGLLERYTKYPPVNIRGLARALDVKVVDEDNPTGSGYISVEENGEYIIHVNVNKKYSTGQQNFIIAHELAHFLLHKDFLDKKRQLDRDASIPGLVDIEAEAHALAANILMPKDVINNLVMTNDINSTKDLAEMLKVPESALKIQMGIPMPAGGDGLGK